MWVNWANAMLFGVSRDGFLFRIRHTAGHIFEPTGTCPK